MCSAQAGMLTTYPLSRASLPSLPPEPISKRTSGDATAPRGRRRRRVSPAQLEPDGHRGPRRRGALHGREDRWSGEGGSAEVDPDRRSADVWVLPPRGIYVDWPPVRHSIPSWRQWAVPLEQHADPTQEFTRGINAVNPMPTLLSVLWATEVPLNRNVDHPTTDGVGDRSGRGLVGLLAFESGCWRIWVEVSSSKLYRPAKFQGVLLFTSSIR